MKLDSKKDILIVNLRVTYNDKDIYDENGMIKKDYLKQITSEYWLVDYEQAVKVKYVIGIKDGDIKSIYKSNPSKMDAIDGIFNGKHEIRIKFELEDLDDRTKDKIKYGLIKKKVKLEEYTTMYLRSEDILS